MKNRKEYNFKRQKEIQLCQIPLRLRLGRLFSDSDFGKKKHYLIKFPMMKNNVITDKGKLLLFTFRL